MHAQGPKRIFGGVNGGQRFVPPEIPESNLTVAAPGDELPDTTPLDMDICDPLLVLTPNFDHRGGGLQPLIENTDSTVAKASNEDVAGDLIRSQ